MHSVCFGCFNYNVPFLKRGKKRDRDETPLPSSLDPSSFQSLHGRAKPLVDQASNPSAQIETLTVQKTSQKVKDCLYTLGGMLMCFTVIGIPYGVKMLINNPYEKRIYELNKEIWILENVPQAMNDPAWKNAFLKILEELDEYTRLLSYSYLDVDPMSFIDYSDRDANIKSNLLQCHRKIEALKREFNAYKLLNHSLISLAPF